MSAPLDAFQPDWQAGGWPDEASFEADRLDRAAERMANPPEPDALLSWGSEPAPDRPGPDPFAPIGDGPADPAPDPDAEVWEPTIPAPADPPARGNIRHPGHGHPSAMWVYRDAEARPLFAVLRFNVTKPDGTPGKETLPYSFGRRQWTDRKGKRQDRTGWHYKRPLAPRAPVWLGRACGPPCCARDRMRG